MPNWDTARCACGEMGAALVLAAPMAVAAAAAPSCVNVVGLQRSGTNLFEQMLGNCGVP